MEGKKFKHKFLSSLTCEVVAETRKGYKVLETQVFNGRKKPKTKTAPIISTLILTNSVAYGKK